MLSLAGCSHDFTVRNLHDGSEIQASLDVLRQELTLSLPDGERAVGTVGMLTTKAVGEGSLFFGANMGELLGRNVGAERIYGHVQAVGDRRTRIEAVLSMDWLGHGYGVARTSDNRQWSINF